MKQGWEEKKLGDVCELINRGISPKYIDNNGVVVLNQKCIRGHKVDFEPSRFHDASLKKVSPEKFIKNGDVLINSTGTGTLGRVAQVREDLKNVTVDSHVTIVRPQRSLFYKDFFGWALILIEDEIAKRGEGCGGQTELARSALKDDFKISFPKSHAEQKRIAAILDESFAAIATAKANAEQNLKNAKELFENYLQGVFENSLEGWSEEILQTVVESTCTLSYGIVQPGEEYRDGLAIVRPTDLTSRFIGLDGLKRIDPKLADGYKRTKLMGGELLLCVRGTTGIVAVASKDLAGSNVTRGIVPVRFNQEIIEPDFGYYLLVSRFVQKQIKEKTYGAALMQINIGDLRNIRVVFPKKSLQKDVVSKLDALSSQTNDLEKIYQRKVFTLEELKKSILQKAFNGELKGAIQ